MLVACTLPLTSAYSVHATPRSRAWLQQFVSELPDGDALSAMAEPQLVSWSRDLGLSINDTVNHLMSPRVTINVVVKLVGLHGDGRDGVTVGDHDLQMYLRTLHNQLETVALHPEPHHLVVKPEVQFLVQPTFHEMSKRLNNVLSAAVSQATATSQYTETPMALIPASLVDAVVAEDWAAQQQQHGGEAGSIAFTLYILSPGVTARYAYTYDASASSCPGALYVSPKERYAWFDLSAELQFYGPGPGGKGQVFSHSVPRLSHYKAESVSQALLPDLSALAWSAVQHLVWPPLHHPKLRHYKEVSIHIVTMHQSLLQPPSRVDIAALQSVLQDAVAGVQQVKVHEHWVAFADCDHCITAYAGALRTRATRSAVGAASGGSFKMELSKFLDLAALQAWLTEWREAILADASVHYVASERSLTLPVFVFDLSSTEPVLLDGWRQAVALPSGDVVAVRSAAPPYPVFFGCWEKQAHVDPKELQRPVLAAVLEAGWGVTDTSLFWSPFTGRAWSFLWSLGPTPFGPLSSLAQLSFAQRDAMQRNLALASINASVSNAAHLLRGFARLSGAEDVVKKHLLPNQVRPYNQRVALLLYKLQEAAISLGQMRHKLAIGYALNMAHDVGALHRIISKFKDTVGLDLVCNGMMERRLWLLLPLATGVVAAALIVWRVASGGTERDKASKGF